MEKLFLHMDQETLKARKVEPYEKLDHPLHWKDLQFQYTDSRLLMINWPILLPELEPETARALLDLVGSRYPFSPHQQKLKALCPEISFKKDLEEWVFFGGSFNPWHKGHQACLNMLPEDKYCFILPDRNPQKDLKEVEPVSTIIELVTKIKFGKHHYIAPTFLLDFQKNPTITWIEKLKAEFPDKKLSLLMGFDSFKNVMSWVRAEELLTKLHALYVVSRMEDESDREEALAPVIKCAPDLNVNFLGGHEFENISSTLLRKSLMK